MTILVVMAMRAEAMPVIERLGATQLPARVEGLPARWFIAERWGARGDDVVVAVNGVDPLHGVDSIGTDAATLTAWESVRSFDPSWVVSAGTAGGFAERGGHVGQVVVARGPLVHHDRRIPLGRLEGYGRGGYPTAALDRMAAELGFASGPCSTGNSLDAPDLDLVAMAQHGTVAKDMESAAVAAVANRTGRSFTCLRVITDLVDRPEPAADQFTANLAIATATLAEALPSFLAALPRAEAAGTSSVAT